MKQLFHIFPYSFRKKVKDLLFCNRLVFKKDPKPFYPRIQKGKIEDVSIEKLNTKYGSPLFVVSEKRLKEKYKFVENLIKKSCPNFSLAYSFKTNYLPGICQVFKDLGAMAEVVSGFEYFLAKKIGYKGREIIFNGPYKKDRELEVALKNKALINVDNFDELKRIEEIVKKLKIKSKIGIRLNSTILGKSHFGFNIEKGKAQKAAEEVKKNESLSLVGLQMHIGNNLPPYFYKKEAEILSDFSQRLGQKLEYIDLGGGFPAYGSPHTDAWCSCIFPLEYYFQGIGRVLKKKFPLKDIKVFFEPGRCLVDEGVILIATVINSQPLIVNASISILRLAQWRKLLVKPLVKGGNLVKTNIYGVSCRESDILVREARLPRLKAGNKLIFYNVGAYNIPQSSQFSFPRPGVVMIRKDKSVSLLEGKEKFKDLIRI